MERLNFSTKLKIRMWRGAIFIGDVSKRAVSVCNVTLSGKAYYFCAHPRKDSEREPS